MNAQSYFALLLGKLTNFCIRLFGLGAGATWPGEIAIRIDPHILTAFFNQIKEGSPTTWNFKRNSSVNKSGMTDKGIILVAGTNGKTTTVRMIETILKHAGRRVALNPSGANLDNGLVSAFLSDVSWVGKLHSEYFLFEVDEATFPKVVQSFSRYSSREESSTNREVFQHSSQQDLLREFSLGSSNNKNIVIVLLNLFRDQLDRYGEVDAIAEKWLDALTQYSSREESSTNREVTSGSSRQARTIKALDASSLIINADDPQLAAIGQKLSPLVTYFGLEDPSLYLPKIQHATDSIYCPHCGKRLTFAGVYFSHLGKWTCGNCGLNHPDVSVTAKDFISPLEGVYNKYNTIAAASVGRALALSDASITEGLKRFTPAFGRMETVTVDGKTVKILLSKNPTGFNESLRTALQSDVRSILLVLNDRIPDGRDVSWIWDVDFEILANKHANKTNESTRIFVSGDRCYDMGLRIKYATKVESGKLTMENKKSNMQSETSPYTIDPDLEHAIQQSLDGTHQGETLWILATYSAMLEVRKILTGKKIL